MGIRGELYTTEVVLDNRSYFFNVKENRTGDVFLQVVESKSRNGEDYDRQAICIFAEDMQKFFKGLDDSVSFIDKERKVRIKKASEKKAAKASTDGKKVYKKKTSKEGKSERKPEGIKKTGKVIHVVSKRTNQEESN